jgi:peptidoglycan hydrolase-like protein with peptidoglycan-binding domain
MRKVYDFSTFNYLYEAESTTAGSSTSTESSKLYDKTLGLIITTALNSYSSELTFPEKLYDQNIDADIASVKAVGAEEKPKALVAIMDKVKAASEDNTLEGAKEAVDAWVAAGTKATEALAKMVDQYKDKPEELKHINDFINARLDAYLKGIQDSSKANTLKGALSTKNESGSYYGSDYIFEGILEGKKGMIGDISKQITLVNAKLASLLLTPGMEADVKRLQTEVTKISADMGALLGKKNSEISKDEIKKAAARLAEIPTEADKAAETMLKQDTTNKEAAAILVQALGLVDEAKDKEVVYLGKKEEALKKEKDSSVIKYEESKAGEANGKVAEFQKLVMDKFKDVKSISGLSQFKNMGTSGKFGPSTAEMVKILKSGYGLPDSDSPDITGTLFAELKKDEEIKESRILSFEGFYGINEAFDVKAATQTASKSSSGSSGGGKKKGKGKSHKIAYKKLRLLYKKGDEGSPVVAINRIVGQTSDEKNYTEDTMERVKDFQKLNGLYKDGVAGEDTLTALFNTRGAYKAEPKPKLNDEKAPRGPWAYQMIAKILGETYELPDPKKNNVSSDIGDIFKAIVKATNGPGTDEQALVKAIKRIKTVDDIKVLNSMFDQAARNKANN